MLTFLPLFRVYSNRIQPLLLKRRKNKQRITKYYWRCMHMFILYSSCLYIKSFMFGLTYSDSMLKLHCKNQPQTYHTNPCFLYNKESKSKRRKSNKLPIASLLKFLKKVPSLSYLIKTHNMQKKHLLLHCKRKLTIEKY